MQKNPLAGVDANLLVALDVLLSEANVGRAARSLGLSASAMSHALARLRSHFGDPLLVRAGQRMILTERGRCIAGPLREALALLHVAVSASSAFDVAAQQRALRIAAADFPQQLLLPAFHRTLRREAPRVDLIVTGADNASLKALANGELDLVLGSVGSAAGFHSRALREEPFVCLLRRAHPALDGRWTAKRFAALGHVLISPRGRTLGAVDRALKKRGLSRRVAVVVPTFSTAARLVAESDLVCTCAARSAKQAEALLPVRAVAAPLSIAPFPVSLLWHERQAHDPFLTWAREKLAEAALEA